MGASGRFLLPDVPAHLVGGLIPGIIAGIIAHYLTVPVIKAYHKRRAKKMADRIARLRALGQAKAARPAAGETAAPQGDQAE